MKNETQLKGGKRYMKGLLRIFVMGLLVTSLFGVYATALNGGSNWYIGDYKPLFASHVETFPTYLSDREESDSGQETKFDVEVKLSPEKQFTVDGNAEYKIILRDKHNREGDEISRHVYALEFVADKNVAGEFDITKVTIPDGEKQAVTLKVKTEQKGVNQFGIRVLDENGIKVASAIGALVYGSEIPTERENRTRVDDDGGRAAFFHGEGVAVQSDTNGQLVVFTLLNKNGEIEGKIEFGEMKYRAQGTFENDKLMLQLTDIKSENKNLIGTFRGNIQKFDNFLLLRGLFLFNKENDAAWDTTAFTKRKDAVFRKFSSSDEDVSFNEVKPTEIIEIEKPMVAETTSIAVDSTTEQTKESVYIRPVGVKKTKLFGWEVPFVKPKVEIEIVDGTNIYKKEIKAFESTDIDSYKISVGSLEDPNNLEVSIKKSTR